MSIVDKIRTPVKQPQKQKKPKPLYCEGCAGEKTEDDFNYFDGKRYKYCKSCQKWFEDHPKIINRPKDNLDGSF